MATPNSQMQAILDVYGEMNPLPIETLTAEQARVIPLPDRAAFAYYGQHITKRALAPMPPPVERVEHRLIPGGNNGLVTRIYAPKKETPDGGWPIAVYFHGGGWVIANLDTYDGSARAVAIGADCMVVSVHYRQAPENPWPAAAEDAFGAYQWVLQNAASLGGDPRRVAVIGESAGGNLAAVVCLMARDNGVTPPVHQVLIYPVTDLVDGMNSSSAIENKDAKPLNRAMLSWFYDQYAPEGVDRSHAYVSPLLAKTLANLPSATVLLSEIDPLRNDGEKYAVALKGSGVAADLKIFPGVTHEFFGMAGLVSEATEAVSMACRGLKTAFKQ